MNVLCPICGMRDGQFDENFRTFSCINCRCSLNLCEFVANSLSKRLFFEDVNRWGFRRSKESELSGLISYNYITSRLDITSYDIQSSLLIAHLLNIANIPYKICQANVESFGGSCPVCGSRIGISAGSKIAGCTSSKHFVFENVETMVACLAKRQYEKLVISIKKGEIKSEEVNTIYLVETETVDTWVDNPNRSLFQPSKIKKTVEIRHDYGIIVKNHGDDHVVWIPRSFTNRGFMFELMINGAGIRNLRAVVVEA